MARFATTVPYSVPVCIALLVAGPSGVAGQALPEMDSLPPGVTMAMVDSGRVLFRGAALCATCHGPAAEGDVGPNLTDDDWLQEKGSYLSILEVIIDGVPEARSSTGTAMPPRGDTDLSDAEARAVAAYVWRMSHPSFTDSLPPGVTPAMVRSGESLFLGKAGCALCHGADATGLLGPDLTDDDWLDAKGSYLTIGRIIARGIPIEESRSGTAMPPRGGSEISPQDIERVAAYIWYLSHANPHPAADPETSTIP